MAGELVQVGWCPCYCQLRRRLTAPAMRPPRTCRPRMDKPLEQTTIPGAMKVPITRPALGPEEAAALAEPLATGWIVQGPKVSEFERAFCELSRAPHALATTSCTTALHLALSVLGVGTSDEVIVPSFTYVASANVVEQCGAKTVFVDIDSSTFNLDPAALEAALSPRTRAIMVVHLFGLVADMAPIMAIARDRGIPVIEDAACAVGSRLLGRHAGTFGDFGAFSFHARKVVTTGEGGMLTVSDDDQAELASVMRSHGGQVSDLERHRVGAFALPEHEVVGFNYRMTDLQAAVGNVQLGRLDELVGRRREIAAAYDEALSDVPGVVVPHLPNGAEHTYQSYVLRITNQAAMGRDEVAVALQRRGISTRQGTHAVHLLAYYRHRYGVAAEDFPQSLDADRTSLSLPIFPAMTPEEQDYVIAGLRDLLG
jgi:perosamine synthetase